MSRILESHTFWIFATLFVILLGWAQHLRFSFKIDILKHKLLLYKTDVDIARKYLMKIPDFPAYTKEVIEAINSLPKE